ncbi:MAG: TonB-dependent receptor [Saprospiraceae bacterium]|nr:TonB-dependent receptor [Saprospiraceae bacterium]
MRQFLSFVLGMFILTGAAYGQRVVTGTVTDEAGQALIGANVVAKEASGIGTITYVDGNYRLNVPENVKTLVFSYAGYNSKEMAIGTSSVINVSLSEGKLLDEVVVVGYGVQRKADLTGSIASIKGSEIALAPVQSFDQALQGRAAGVQITTPNGVLNNPPVIRVRGTNSINLNSQPLIVIDGVPTFTDNLSTNSAANNPLGNINPADIESFEILKDASASAIYGSRAAAGVILVTTKRGKKGSTKVNYDGWIGYTTPFRLFNLLNAEQYLLIKNEALANANSTGRYTPAFDVNGNIIDTRWYDHVNQTGFSHNHSLNFNGGSESTTYYLSVGYTEQQGFLRGNDFGRTNARLNLDHKLTKAIKVGTNINYTNSINSGPNSGSLAGQAFSIAGLGRLPLVLQPILAPFVNAEGKGSQTKDPGFDYNINSANTIGAMGNTQPVAFYNPNFILDFNKHSSENNHFIGSVYGDVEIVKGLNFRTTYGIDRLNIENITFWDRRHGDGFGNGGLAANNYDKLNRWNWQNTLNYLTTLGEMHNIGILVGTEQQKTNQDRWGAQRTVLSDPFFTTYQGNFTTITPSANFQTENFLTSVFSRLNYGFNNRLFASFNFRRDGYSAFATGRKFGNFYGGSLGYTLSEEEFWKNALGSTVNYFKLRASYGLVGNSAVGDFAALSLYGSGLYGPSPTLLFSQAGNPELTWETSKKLDVGFTVGLFEDKIQGEFAYYKNDVDGLILAVPQAPSKGIPGNSVNANVGAMVNSGIELTLTYNAVRTTDFDYSVSLNFTTQKNEVLNLGPTGADIQGFNSGLESSNITRVGQSIGSLYVVQTAGVNPENGRRIFLRRDIKDGVETYTQVQYNHAAPAASRWTLVSDGSPTTAVTIANSGVIFGPTLPTYFGGLNNNFRFKSLDLNVFFQFSGGNYIYNGTKAGLRDMRQWNNHTDVLDRWTPENTNGSIPRVVFGDNVSNGSALPISENVEKGDFIRLRNVVLGYTLPKSLTNKISISNLRLYGQIQNAFVITDYTGADPEISSNGNTNIAPGVDRNSVGQGRTYTFGLQVGF